jgi:ATP-dependent Clp protease protease subunit
MRELFFEKIVFFSIFSENTGKDLATIEADTDRDNFFEAEEALAYGLIDKVIDKR